jgi:hypothetical protein
MVDQLEVEISVGTFVKRNRIRRFVVLFDKTILRDHTPTTNMSHRMSQGRVQGTQVIQKGEYKAYGR